MKKELYIISVISIILLLSLAINKLLQNETEIRIKTGNYIIDTKFESVSEITDEQLKNHFETASTIFLGKDYFEFSNSQMVTVGILDLIKASNQKGNSIVLDSNQLNAYINYYFGNEKDNFEVQTGNYELIGYGDINVINKSKINIEIPATGLEWDKTNKFIEVERVDNNVIVHYEYQEWVFEGIALDGYFETQGQAKFYCSLKNGYLSLNKIEFSPL